MTGTDMAATLAALTSRWEQARPYNIGFPGATDLDFTELAPLLAGYLLNNVGDAWVDGIAVNHTKEMEREVVDFFADLFRVASDDRWGYVTSGGSEANLYGLWLARTLHLDAVTYFSAEAHPSIPKAAALLGLPTVIVRAEPEGTIDYQDLARQIDQRRDRAVIVVANIGTTMTEAVDDVRRIMQVLDELAIRRRYIHADAALSGIPLSLMDSQARPGFDLADGADSIACSGHKFTGVVTPCGVVVTRKTLRDRLSAAVAYTGSSDTTIIGSRSGHAPLMLWYAIRRLGVDGLRARAERSRALAEHLQTRLADLRWPASRHPHAMTVVLQTPPQVVLKKWVLVTRGERSHIITAPGTTQDSLDAFVDDLRAAINTPPDRRSDPVSAIPPQRHTDTAPQPPNTARRVFRTGR
jgi:histidine decarboxylase